MYLIQPVRLVNRHHLFNAMRRSYLMKRTMHVKPVLIQVYLHLYLPLHLIKLYFIIIGLLLTLITQVTMQLMKAGDYILGTMTSVMLMLTQTRIGPTVAFIAVSILTMVRIGFQTLKKGMGAVTISSSTKALTMPEKKWGAETSRVLQYKMMKHLYA